jgi:hypothetical protein
LTDALLPMAEPLCIDCYTPDDFPPLARLRELVTPDQYVVLQLHPEREPRFGPEQKDVWIEWLAGELREFTVFNSGAPIEHPAPFESITLLWVIPEAVVLAHAEEFVAAMRLFRRTATDLATRLAARLGVAPAGLLEGRPRLHGPGAFGLFGRVSRWLGWEPSDNRLDREWVYYFHGGECCFVNRLTGQKVEVPLRFGDEFGAVDPWFFAIFVRTTPGLAGLRSLFRDGYHDMGRICQVLLTHKRLRVVRGPTRPGWPARAGFVVVDEDSA